MHIHIVKLTFKHFFLRCKTAETVPETRIYPVPGDGHCLIYSWGIAMVDSEKAQFKPSYNYLRYLINEEYQSNMHEYSSFLTSRSPHEELLKYLKEKCYSQEIGDIVINILANVTSTSAYIYVGGEGDGYIQSNFVEPRSFAVNGEIRLFKRGEHYDPIVNRNFERKGMVKKFFS